MLVNKKHLIYLKGWVYDLSYIHHKVSDYLSPFPNLGKTISLRVYCFLVDAK